MKPYISHSCRDLLACHGLDTFERLWDLPWQWVEQPNKRRNGWSGASRHDMVDDKRGNFSFIVKRQENHNYRSLCALYRARPTYSRAISNIRRLEQIGVPTVEPLFYGERRKGDKYQAVLATRMLEGYSDLNALFADPTLAAPVRSDILRRLAEVLQVMHRHHMLHNNLSGKHVLVRIEKDGTFDLRLLDLERMRRWWMPVDVAVRDLEKLIRHSPTLTPREFAELVCHYALHWSPIRRMRLVAKINRRLAAKWRYGMQTLQIRLPSENEPLMSPASPGPTRTACPVLGLPYHAGFHELRRRNG